MKLKLFSMLIGIGMLSACTKEGSAWDSSASFEVKNRTRQNCKIELTMLDGSKFETDRSYFTATSYGNNSIFFVINPGSQEAQTIIASSVLISDADDGVKITVGSGQNPVIYRNASSVVLTPANNAMNIGIQSGNINISAASIIGEEENGI